MSFASKCRAAVLQCVSTDDFEKNCQQVAALLREAKAEACELVVLPENFAYFSGHDIRAKAEQEGQDLGPVMRFLAEQAADLALWLVGGTTPLIEDGKHKRAADKKVFAGCVVFGPDGKRKGQYNKMHLFDASVDDAVGSYRESDQYMPGDRNEVVATPWGDLGLSVCYDLRFPEFFRRMSSPSLTMLAAPSAFTYRTGEAHWEILVRARAIENQVFVLAANQGGTHPKGRETWGHSMIVDPWGRVLAQKETPGPGCIYADLNFEALKQVRSQLPVLSHRVIR